MLKLAEEHDLFVQVALRPGAFALHGECLAKIWTKTPLPAAVTDQLKSSFVLGAHRTTLQDILFAFEQISEIAMRAMSPGINDPTTAVHCVDRIGSGVTRLVGRGLPSKWRTDSEGVVRIEIESAGLSEILDSTVIAVSRTAGVHLPVWLRLIEVLRIADRAVATRVFAVEAAALSACAHATAYHEAESRGLCHGDRPGGTS
jgi:uncharacterized membrane protein